MNKVAYLIILFTLFFAKHSIADCYDCFDLARVEITYKDGHTEETYMYIDTYYGQHVKQPDELNDGFKYHVLKEYINIYDGKLDLNEVSTAIDASIFVNDEYKYMLEPSLVNSIKEIEINDHISERNIDIDAYKTIRNESPIDYYKFYDSDFGYAFVAISYNEKIKKRDMINYFNKCGLVGDKSIKCMEEKAVNLEKVYFFYVALDGC